MADYHLEGMTDEFFEQMLYMPGYASSSSGPSDHGGASSGAPFLEMGTRTTFPSSIFPLGLNLEQGKVSFFKPDNDSGSNINQFSYDPHRNSPSTVGTNSDVNPSKTDSVQTFGKIVASVRPTVPQSGQGVVAPQRFHGHPTNSGTMAHPPTVRSRPRARRGQATDPHSIAERLRRVRIAEKIKQLQELVPNCNKTDRAAMLDEIMDYIKFLRLQVNVLSMSRLGETGSVAQLLSGVSCLKVEGDDHGGTIKQQQQEVCDKWLADGTEHHVAKLMEEDVGAAMQFLQSKDLCLLPISLAMATFTTNHLADLPAASLKSETNSRT